MITLNSTPAQPAELHREIGGVSFTLNAEGLAVGIPGRPIVRLDVAEALAVSDFLRGPGARALLSRAWLAEQHAAALAESEQRRAA